MKHQRGFSLIELLVVIVVIGIIASIAIPNIIAIRRAANEGAAIETVRVLHSGEIIYMRSAGAGFYTNQLSELATHRIIEPVLGTGSKSGFSFALAVDSTMKLSFTIGARPIGTSGATMTGSRKFCSAIEGVIRFESNPSLLGTNIQNDGDCNSVGYSATLN